MQDLRENGRFVIAAMNQGRFKAFSKMLNREEKAPGSTVSVYNNKTGEALTYHHSIHACVGKKLVYSNAFDVVLGKNGFHTTNFR